jgi:hypothetical protein
MKQDGAGYPGSAENHAVKPETESALLMTLLNRFERTDDVLGWPETMAVQTPAPPHKGFD